MKSQDELKRRAESPTYFERRYPIWKCPNCGWLNQFVDTFGEHCSNCKEDYTTNWTDFMVSE